MEFFQVSPCSCHLTYSSSKKKMATKINFLTVHYNLGHQMPQILPNFLTLFFSDRIKTKTNAHKAFS